MKLSRLIPFSLVFDRLVECQEETNAGHLKKCSSSEIVNWKNAMKEWKHARNGNFSLFKGVPVDFDLSLRYQIS